MMVMEGSSYTEDEVAQDGIFFLMMPLQVQYSQYALYTQLNGAWCTDSPKPALLISSGRHLHMLRGVQSALCTVIDRVQL